MLRRIAVAVIAVTLFAVHAGATPPAPPIEVRLVDPSACLGDSATEVEVELVGGDALSALPATLYLLANGGSVAAVRLDGGKALSFDTTGTAIGTIDRFDGDGAALIASASVRELATERIRLRLEPTAGTKEVTIYLDVPGVASAWRTLRPCGVVDPVPTSSAAAVAAVKRVEDVPSAIGVLTVTYTFEYTDNEGFTRRLRNAQVELWDDDSFSPDDLLASGSTDSQGSITFNVSNTGDEAGGQDIYFVTYARRTGVVDVTVSGTDTYHWFTDPPIANVADGTYNYASTIAPANNSGAANIYDALNQSFNYIAGFASPDPSQVMVTWPASGSAHSGGRIYVRGGSGFNQDEFDESVTIHEYGHFLDDVYAGGFTPDGGGSDGYGGNGHQFTSQETNAIAWGEGWADFLQSAIRQVNGYANANSYVTDEFSFSMESGGSYPGGNALNIEIGTAATLWDLFDAQDDAGDTLTDGFTRLWGNFDLGTGNDTIFDFWARWVAAGNGSRPQLSEILWEHGCYGAVTDTTNPTVTITTPTTSSTYSTGLSSLGVGGTASDDLHVSSVSWRNDTTGAVGTASGMTSWSATIPLQLGQNTLTITARDRKNNAGTDTLTVTRADVDSTPPTISITTPVSNGTYQTSQSNVSLAGNAGDNVGVTSVTWSSNRGVSGTASGTSPTWSASNIPLFAGLNVITVVARDAAGNQGQAVINVTYTQPCALTVTWPNGPGLTLYKGQQYVVTWNSSGGCAGAVRVELLRGGSLVQTPTPSTENNGVFYWTIDSGVATASDYAIRIGDTTSSATDTSDATFAIAPQPSCTINVTAPSGGATWTRGASNTIQWTSGGDSCASTVRLELWHNGALNSTIASAVPNNGSYNWTIPISQPFGSGYSIRVVDSEHTNFVGTSASFTIVEGESPCTLTMVAPNGGERWVRGTQRSILWSGATADCGNVNVDLFRNTAPVLRIATDVPASNGGVAWTLPANLADGGGYSVFLTYGAGFNAAARGVFRVEAPCSGTGCPSLLLEEQFDGGAVTWNGTFNIADGAMRVPSACVTLPYGFSRSTGLRIEADVRIDQGAIGDFYLFALFDELPPSCVGGPPREGYSLDVAPVGSDSTSDYLSSSRFGSATELRAVPVSMPAGQWAHVELDLLPNGQIDYYLNGALKMRTVNSDHNFGSVAMRTWTDVLIDNVRVWSGIDAAPASDWNGDRTVDLVWRHSGTGQNAVWVMNRYGVGGVGLLPSVADPAWSIAGVADVDIDGRPDLVWRNNATGQNACWLMYGTSFLTSLPIPNNPDTNWRIETVADVTGDGRADLVWRNLATGANAIWAMNGVTIVGTLSLPAVADLNWRIVGAGDFDNDSKTDIVWRHGATGQNAIWALNKGVYKTSMSLPTNGDLQWQIAGAADFDGDQRPDLLWRNYTTGADAIWFIGAGGALLGTQTLPSSPDTAWKLAAPR